MIYFDNSASTLLKPKNVQRAVLSALTTFSANPGRSGHIEALKSAMEVEKVREKLKKLSFKSVTRRILKNLADSFLVLIFKFLNLLFVLYELSHI